MQDIIYWIKQNIFPLGVGVLVIIALILLVVILVSSIHNNKLIKEYKSVLGSEPLVEPDCVTLDENIEAINPEKQVVDSSGQVDKDEVAQIIEKMHGEFENLKIFIDGYLKSIQIVDTDEQIDSRNNIADAQKIIDEVRNGIKKLIKLICEGEMQIKELQNEQEKKLTDIGDDIKNTIDYINSASIYVKNNYEQGDDIINNISNIENVLLLRIPDFSPSENEKFDDVSMRGYGDSFGDYVKETVAPGKKLGKRIIKRALVIRKEETEDKND